MIPKRVAETILEALKEPDHLCDLTEYGEECVDEAVRWVEERKEQEKVESEDDETIRPCPFCGSSASVKDGDGDAAGGNYIGCDNDACGASSNIMFHTKDDALPVLREKWNARVPTPHPHEY